MEQSQFRMSVMSLVIDVRAADHVRHNGLNISNTTLQILKASVDSNFQTAWKHIGETLRAANHQPWLRSDIFSVTSRLGKRILSLHETLCPVCSGTRPQVKLFLKNDKPVKKMNLPKRFKLSELRKRSSLTKKQFSSLESKNLSSETHSLLGSYAESFKHRTKDCSCATAKRRETWEALKISIVKES